MSQDVILQKFIAFSKIKYAEYHAELEKVKKLSKDPVALKKINARQAELKKNHERLIKNLDDDGYCFGFCLTHAMMDLDGKLLWWESLLQKIMLWDESEESLKEIISLPDGKQIKTKSKKHQKKDFIKKQKTLEQLLTRAMNYVVSIQCADSPFIHTPNQLKILQPNAFEDVVPDKPPGKKKSFFECLRNGSIQSIQQYKSIAGHFTKPLLQNILDNKKLADCIILVHGADHTIRLAWTGSTWMVYDSNDDHSDLNTIHFTGSKDECIDKIFDILGTSLYFEFASFDPKKVFEFPAYETIKRNNISLLLRENGIFQWANVFPEELVSHLNKALKSPKSRNRIIKQCHVSFNNPYYDNNCGLDSIMSKDRRLLPLILKLGKESPYYDAMHKNILDALKKKNSDNSFPLMTLIEYRPQNILSLLEFLVKDKDSLLFTLNLFLDKNNDNETAWSILDKQSPEHRKKIINFLVNKMSNINHDFYAEIPSPEKLPFPILLLKALTLNLQPNNSSMHNSCLVGHALQAVLIKKPDLSPTIAKLALATPNGFDELMNALNLKNPYTNKTNWQRLKKRVEKTEILTLISQHIQQMDEATLKVYRKKFRSDSYRSSACFKQTMFENPALTDSLNSLVLQKIEIKLFKLQSNPVFSASDMCRLC